MKTRLPEGWQDAIANNPSRLGFKEHIFSDGIPRGCVLTDGTTLMYGTPEYREWAEIRPFISPILKKPQNRKKGVSNSRSEGRELGSCCSCDAIHTPSNPITCHHAIPTAYAKELGRKFGKRPKNSLLPICLNCHKLIHKLMSNQQLGRWFNTPHALRLLVESVK